MSEERQQLETAIAALEAQRALLGDAVVDTALAPMRRELAATRSAESATNQQLKQVSVLFVDVVESTAMGQRLDPEEIHAVMDGALISCPAGLTVIAGSSESLACSSGGIGRQRRDRPRSGETGRAGEISAKDNIAEEKRYHL